MSTKDSSTNFLLQVTLLRTSTPVDTRLLFVPPKALFETLHKAIETAFDWSENEASNGKTLPIFSVVHGSQLEIGGPKGMKLFVQIANKGEQEFNDRLDMWDASLAKVDQVFDNFSLRKRSIFYDYRDGFFHAVQLLGRSSYDTEGKILCLCGQDNTTQKTWAQRRASFHGMVPGGPRSWKFEPLDFNRSLKGRMVE